MQINLQDVLQNVGELDGMASIVTSDSIRFAISTASIRDLNEAYIKLYTCMYEIMNEKPLPPGKISLCVNNIRSILCILK